MVDAAAWCAAVHFAAGIGVRVTGQTAWHGVGWRASTRDLGVAIVATRLYRAVYNLSGPGIHFLCALVLTTPLWQGVGKRRPDCLPEVDAGVHDRRLLVPAAREHVVRITTPRHGDFCGARNVHAVTSSIREFVEHFCRSRAMRGSDFGSVMPSLEHLVQVIV